MSSRPARDLRVYLSQVPDPRGRQGQRHSLAAMLAAVVCAVLSGARGNAALVQWLNASGGGLALAGVYAAATEEQLFSYSAEPPQT